MERGLSPLSWPTIHDPRADALWLGPAECRRHEQGSLRRCDRVCIRDGAEQVDRHRSDEGRCKEKERQRCEAFESQVAKPFYAQASQSGPAGARVAGLGCLAKARRSLPVMNLRVHGESS